MISECGFGGAWFGSVVHVTIWFTRGQSSRCSASMIAMVTASRQLQYRLIREPF